MTTFEAIKLAKKALRDEVASRIKAIAPKDVARQSAAVCEKLFHSSEFANSKRVSVYLSMETELQTTSILSKLFSTGRECFVPRYGKTGMEMVKLLSMEDYEKLPETKWKIKQPALSEKRENALEKGGLDLVLCPGVAFTKGGDRLGHGAGFYDKYIGMLLSEMQSQNCRPFILGLALKEQMVEFVPTSEFDLKMDKVLYDDY